MLSRGIALLLAAGVAPGLRADATIRYRTEVSKSLETSPTEPKVLRVKGHKLLSSYGSVSFITDLDAGTCTVIDAEHKAAVSVPSADLYSAFAARDSDLPPVPPGTPKVESRMTGRRQTILGVEAEEREIIVSWAAPGQAANTDRSVKIRAHLWTATQAEAARVPALREITGRKAGVQDLELMSRKILGSEAWARAVLEAIRQPTVELRVQVEVYIPMMMARARELLERAGQPARAFDPKAPFLKVDQIATEISDTAVDPAAFAVPSDYRSLSPEKLREVLRGSS